MAFVEKRGTDRWRARYRDPAGKERSRTFTRRVDAERFLTTVEGDKLRGTWTDPASGKTTVAEWSRAWRATKVDLRASSLARLDATLATQVLPEWGDTPLQGITNAAVRAWVARMSADGLSASSVRKAYFALHQMLSAAVADRRIAFDPTMDVPLPPERQGEQRFLTADQVETLADAIESRFRALVLVAAYGGLRFGELAALRRNRVDLLRGRVTVAETLVDLNGKLTFGPPKTRKGYRTVPLPRRVIRELETHMSAYVGVEPDALVFTNTEGAPLRRAGFRRSWWQPAVRAAGLERLCFHELRHTFVSLWVAAGANVKEVSVRAGHSSVAFTLDRYGHLYEDADDAIADRLDALLDSARPSGNAGVRRLSS